MSRLLSDILGAPEPTFSHEIDRLERISGHPKIDLRLISDVKVDTKKLLERLEMDPNDTTMVELYYGLQRNILLTNNKLAKSLGIGNDDSPEQVIKACIKYVERMLSDREVWSIKNVSAKQQLSANIPKKLLKALGLRSLESALKREPICELTFLSQLIETTSWRENFYTLALRLTSNDFTKKKIMIAVIDQRRQQRLSVAKHTLKHFVYKHEETGSLLVAVPGRRFRGDVIFFVDSLIRESNSLIRWGAFAKLLSMRPDFAKWLVSLRRNGLDATSSLYFNFSWGPMHALLEKHAQQAKPPIFEPHIYDEDVLSIDTTSFNDHPPYLVHKENNFIVSANTSDVILNAINQTPIEKSATIYGQRALYDELFSRYLQQEAILDDVLRMST